VQHLFSYAILAYDIQINLPLWRYNSSGIKIETIRLKTTIKSNNIKKEVVMLPMITRRGYKPLTFQDFFNEAASISLFPSAAADPKYHGILLLK